MADCVKLLIARGAQKLSPPNFIEGTGDVEFSLACSDYRTTPWIVYAACHGNLEIVKLLAKAGCSLNDVGHICLSRFQLNSVAGNVIGAAAYHGNREILEYCISKVDSSFIDMKAMETSDRMSDISGGFKPEFNDFTPL